MELNFPEDTRILLDLPPALAHYLERGRNIWLQSSPKSGRLSFLGRSGSFEDIEAMAVSRRHVVELVGARRARSLFYHIGREEGRRDAARQVDLFEKRLPLAMQACTVFGQLRGCFAAEVVRMDLASGRLHREILLHHNVEAQAHRAAGLPTDGCVCWRTAGFLAGHLGELLGQNVIAVEQDCHATGAPACRFVARFDAEWGDEAAWIREADQLPTMAGELEALATDLASARGRITELEHALADVTAQGRRDLDRLPAASSAMRSAVIKAGTVAPLDVPVFLVGPRGSGKLTLARAIHEASRCPEEPFKVFDTRGGEAASLNRHLFGCAAGFGPGTSRRVEGVLRRAEGGAVYINEITLLDREAQGKLVQLIEENVLESFGETPTEAHVRVFAGTSVPNPAERLREELYFALMIGRIDVPPLANRHEDLPSLIDELVGELREKYRRPAVRLHQEAARALADAEWEGNVRQLRSCLEHAFVFAPYDIIRLQDLPAEALAFRGTRAPDELTEEMVRAALRQNGDSRSAAAEMLGVSRTTLWRLMKKHGLE